AYDAVLSLEPNYASAWYQKGLLLEKLSKAKSRWSFKRTSVGDADECFKRAKELGFKTWN
ncbi:MAG: hypothetical protein WB587_07680, partial [Nitrososphaeraceae archaeon]